MASWQRLGAWLSPLLLIGCGDAVTLHDGLDGLALTYRCADIVPQARSTAERAVVRVYSAELMKTESHSDPAEIDAMLTAYDRGEWDDFERLVVQQLCDRPTLAERLSPTSTRSRYANLAPGDPAPSFALPVLAQAFFEGAPNYLSLSDLNGRYVILSFWATWCKPCVAEYPELVEFEHQFGARGLTVVGILHQDSPVAALAFAEQQPTGSYLTLIDADASVAKAYQVFGLPTVVVIDSNGTVLDYGFGWGGAEKERLTAWFDEVLPRGDASALGAI